jgi:hypothetical protein
LDAKLTLFTTSFIPPCFGALASESLIIMKNFIASHRALMALAGLGGYAVVSLFLKPSMAEASSGWFLGVLALFALGLVLVISMVLTLNEPPGLHHALGGLLILTGIIVFNL